jgi:hypothetical protein
MSPGAMARPGPNKGVRRDQRSGPCERLFILESEMNEPVGGKRRKFLQQATAAGLMSLVPNAVRTGAWAAGSDAPEKKEVKIGFIPLTDCSSVVMASVMEFDKKYGIKIVPVEGSLLGRCARQAGQRRTRRSARAVGPDLTACRWAWADRRRTWQSS